MLRLTLPNDPSRLESLPLVTLYLSERCNSRCVTCDYWRYGRADMNLATVRELLPSLRELRTEAVLLSGGEPLLNPEWLPIARLLQGAGLKLWLLTSGLSLAKHAQAVATLFDSVTVSLDGTDAATYAAIRGLDAFDKVCQGIRAAAASGARVTVRVTVQRANYTQWPRFIDLTHQLGAQQVSFLAVDVANPHAFARTGSVAGGLALTAEDLPRLAQLLDQLERDYAAELRTRFVAESPRRLRHIHEYFAAVCAAGDYPPVRCNAPEFSAVIDAQGQVNPCFFIRGDGGARLRQGRLGEVLNAPPSIELRRRIRAGEAPECRTCVCSLWHPPGPFAMSSYFSSERAHG